MLCLLSDGHILQSSLHLYPPKVKDKQKVIPRRIVAEAEFTLKGMVSEWKIEAQYF